MASPSEDAFQRPEQRSPAGRCPPEIAYVFVSMALRLTDDRDYTGFKLGLKLVSVRWHDAVRLMKPDAAVISGVETVRAAIRCLDADPARADRIVHLSITYPATCFPDDRWPTWTGQLVVLCGRSLRVLRTVHRGRPNLETVILALDMVRDLRSISFGGRHAPRGARALVAAVRRFPRLYHLSVGDFRITWDRDPCPTSTPTQPAVVVVATCTPALDEGQLANQFMPLGGFLSEVRELVTARADVGKVVFALSSSYPQRHNLVAGVLDLVQVGRIHALHIRGLSSRRDGAVTTQRPVRLTPRIFRTALRPPVQLADPEARRFIILQKLMLVNPETDRPWRAADMCDAARRAREFGIHLACFDSIKMDEDDPRWVPRRAGRVFS